MSSHSSYINLLFSWLYFYINRLYKMCKKLTKECLRIVKLKSHTLQDWRVGSILHKSGPEVVLLESKEQELCPPKSKEESCTLRIGPTTMLTKCGEAHHVWDQGLCSNKCGDQNSCSLRVRSRSHASQEQGGGIVHSKNKTNNHAHQVWGPKIVLIMCRDQRSCSTKCGD